MTIVAPCWVVAGRHIWLHPANQPAFLPFFHITVSTREPTTIVRGNISTSQVPAIQHLTTAKRVKKKKKEKKKSKRSWKKGQNHPHFPAVAETTQKIWTSWFCTTFIQFSLFWRIRQQLLFMSLLCTAAKTEAFSPSWWGKTSLERVLDFDAQKTEKKWPHT